MDAVVEHLVTIVSEEGMQVDDLKAVLLGNLLLNGNDAIDDHAVVDVPRRLEGGNRRTEQYLRLGWGSASLGCLC